MEKETKHTIELTPEEARKAIRKFFAAPDHAVVDFMDEDGDDAVRQIQVTWVEKKETEV